MTFNILAKKDNGMWIAHCLELDIVATAKTLPTLKKDILDLIVAQVGYAFKNGNLENLYHPAPPEVWEEFYRCKESDEKKVNMKSESRNKSFVPPWIIAKTCLAPESMVA